MLIMTIAIGIMGGGTRIYADEIKDNSEIEEQYFEILAYDAENNRSLAVLSTHNANAEVAGNGVRLRNNPNTNSKILDQPTFLIYNLLTLSIPQIIDYFSLTYGIIVLE